MISRRAIAITGFIGLACGCVFSGGTATGNNTNNTSQTMNASNGATNSGPICGMVACMPSDCGKTLTNDCGDAVTCPDCACLPQSVCPTSACGPTEFPDCGTVFCGPTGEDLAEACSNAASTFGAEPCGEWAEPICESGTVNCGECDGEGRTCTDVNAQKLCCADPAMYCGDNPGFTGMRDLADGCGERMIECPGEPPRPRFVEMAAGAKHTCAVGANRTDVFCWGENVGSGTERALLGMDFPGMNSAVPVLAARSPNGTEIVQIDSGARHVCILLATGVAHCWGDSSDLRLGEQSLTGRFGTVNLPDDIVSIALGHSHSCVLTDKNDVWCWGPNDFLAADPYSADGSALSARPLLVTDGGNRVKAAAIFSGPASAYSCFTNLQNGNLHCWGQIPDGTQSPDAQGIEVIDNDVNATTVGITRAGLAYPFSGAISYQGFDAVLGAQTSTSTNPSVLEGGELFLCGDFDGTVQCAGQDIDGSLGNGNAGASTDAFVSVSVPAQGLAVGRKHACVVGADGYGRCWGSNSEGQLGDSTLEDKQVAVPVQPPRMP